MYNIKLMNFPRLDCHFKIAYIYTVQLKSTIIEYYNIFDCQFQVNNFRSDIFFIYLCIRENSFLPKMSNIEPILNPSDNHFD